MEVYPRESRPAPGMLGRVIAELYGPERPGVLTLLYDDGNNWIPADPFPVPPLGQARNLREDMKWVQTQDTPRNLLINGGLEVWQVARTVNMATGNGEFVADQWHCRSPNVNLDPTGYTISRQPGLTLGSQYSLRWQRNTTSVVAGIQQTLAQNLETRDSVCAAGKYVTFSHVCRLGPGATLMGQFGPNITHYSFILGATTIDAQYQSGAMAAAATVNTKVFHTANYNATRFQQTVFVPENTTQLAAGIFFSHNIAGASPANDYVEFDDFQLEVNDIATNFERRNWAEELQACQRFCQKSFSYEQAPGYNLGFANAEIFNLTNAGAVASSLGVIKLHPRLRNMPALVTFYNPQAVNGMVRNSPQASDAAATTAANYGDNKIQIAITGVAGWVVGAACGVHWLAESRL